MALDLARVPKREVIPDNTAPKSYLLFLSRTTTETLSTNSRTKLRQEKLTRRKVSSLTSWKASTYFKQARNFPSDKSKIKWKSTIEILQRKENSTENSSEKNFKDDSQFNELWNISTKLKRKKYSNSNNFVSRTLSQISSWKLH